MRLKAELAACKSSDTPEQFKKRLLGLFAEHMPGKTLDDLVCEPSQAREYCEIVRKDTDLEWMPDVVPLKTLLNIRKKKDCPKGLKRERTNRRLDKRLKDAGCKMKPDAFRDLLVNAHVDMYKNQTVDNLVCHPREARQLCQFVRNKAKCPDLSDEMILSTLMNVRKAQ
ncbi:hypothetical protein NHH03_22415 [Stieleria sp. TO1_6]|uniref:hypothetical protein n=1 Tax=Stieleria tagensis TaxID=2956795 RepID=UPI00209A63C9|nr:hypothetical protein [Stieleria tagensis]MCO8124510.1 hypothetical protein [Stieleria tagensis]